MSKHLSKKMLELNEIMKETDDLYRNLAKKFKMSDCMIWILYILREDDRSVTQSDICNMMYMPKQTVNSSLKKMEAEGYIELLNINDKRSKQVCLTEKGVDLANNTVDIIISKENKSLYHAAAVTVSNFILGLVNNSLTYLKDCGFSEEIAMEALYPLIEFNLKNIKENGIMESLTGPVERGDLETITSHCKVLNQRDKKMYKLLSENILSIAEMKNKQRNYEKIREYLKR